MIEHTREKTYDGRHHDEQLRRPPLIAPGLGISKVLHDSEANKRTSVEIRTLLPLVKLD